MIRVENLTKFYGSVCAVDHLSFEIRKGEILGLLGPNGAGKSTTLRILTCFLKPTDGTITVKDYNIHDHPLEIKKLIGYLPEMAPLYSEMLVYDYLRFVGGVRELDRDRTETRIRELADLCGLREVMHKSVHELSRGYKQRVGLAQAMLSDPEILVFDEPTAGLDPNQIVEIRDIIKKMGKEKTVVLSTHILTEAEATCDRVVIINRGKIVADGTTDTLKREAGNDYDLHVTLEQADYEAVKTSLSSLPGVRTLSRQQDSNGGLNLVLNCKAGTDVRREVYQAIKKNHWILVEFHREGRTLENIFRELTKEA